MKRILLLMLLIGNINLLIAQTQEQPIYSIIPYGYIAYDVFTDTYKSYDTRDGELYFYPLKPTFDLNGEDLNKKVMLEMLSLSTRFGTKITGPDLFSAKTSSLIETDFFGTSQSNVLQLRLRHAMMNLKWERSELMMGQYWHPIIITEMIPGTVSFGGGAPFHALNRSNQIKYTIYPTTWFKISGAAVVHGYHRSKGEYYAQRNSGKPELIYQMVFGNLKKTFVGFSAGYKWLTPRLLTSLNYQTRKTVGSYLIHGFVSTKINATSFKSEAYFGQNLTHLNMIGGYGMITGSTDAFGEYDYTNLETLSIWTEVGQDISHFNIGVFLGYQKLYGASDNYTSIADYNLNDDLKYIWRFAPRVVYRTDAINIAFEYIQTAAKYGFEWNSKHEVTKSMELVSNHRFLLSVQYKFQL